MSDPDDRELPAPVFSDHTEDERKLWRDLYVRACLKPAQKRLAMKFADEAVQEFRKRFPRP